MLAAGIAGCQGARGIENSQRIATSSAAQQASQPISKLLRTGMSAAQVQAIWGTPDVVAEATGGGRAWVYVNVEAVAITVQRNGHTHIWMQGPQSGAVQPSPGQDDELVLVPPVSASSTRQAASASHPASRPVTVTVRMDVKRRVQDFSYQHAGHSPQ
ncbi:hypothetical protein AAV94_11505 [Lampropedia cohaerens]|uniref:Outer membrane protein assembly factor BamE domain-containing protein n=2 Tax=Lampropedia cohaerens TaxID=1610491 RepID=A0A0U1PY44_9BURK|nr:hypothetical protein AAV94_11505 [Lampropedia cohaerens]